MSKEDLKIAQRHIERVIADRDELLHQLKNMVNVFGQGLDPVENECRYRAVERANAAIDKSNQP